MQSGKSAYKHVIVVWLYVVLISLSLSPFPAKKQSDPLQTPEKAFNKIFNHDFKRAVGRFWEQKRVQMFFSKPNTFWEHHCVTALGREAGLVPYVKSGFLKKRFHSTSVIPWLAEESQVTSEVSKVQSPSIDGRKETVLSTCCRLCVSTTHTEHMNACDEYYSIKKCNNSSTPHAMSTCVMFRVQKRTPDESLKRKRDKSPALEYIYVHLSENTRNNPWAWRS